jgi:hypothetical protein
VGRHWVARMLEDPTFSARVKSRWARLRPAVREVVSQLPQAAATLAPAAQADWQQWHESGDLEWTHHAKTLDGEVAFLGDWLTRRIEWLSLNEVRLGGTRQATEERERTVWVPVQLQTAATSAVDVSWSLQAGSATPGKDYVAEQGQVTFAPGQKERYIPVRILDDTRTERRETVRVRLTGSSRELVIGSPNLATVVIRGNRR